QGAEALKTIEAMRGLAPPQNDDSRIALEEARAHTALGNFPRALAAAQHALQRSEQSGSRHLIARARLLEGRSHFDQGQLGPAEQSLEMARHMFVDIGDRAGAATALNSLAAVLADQQDLSRAGHMYEQ